MIEIKNKNIKMFVMDVDGVLTDGCMYYSENGELLKKFNTKDGMGIEFLKKEGILPVILTKERTGIVLKRAEKLKITHVYLGIINKLEFVSKFCKKCGLSFENVAYIGDDINDIPLLEKVGLSFAPHDAVDAVKEKATYVLSTCGGHGAVREAIDFLLSDTPTVLTKSTPKIVHKPWGQEVWIIENEKYSGKFLEIKKGMSSSLHYHAKKTETMYVLRGILEITYSDDLTLIVKEGEDITLRPGMKHRLKAIEDLKLIEISTPHMGDVIRIEDYYGRN